MVGPKHPVKTVDRTFEIIEIIEELGGAGVSEIAAQTDIGKSAVHNHLTTLASREYVEKDGDEYYIGLPFLGLGAHARDRMPIYEIAKPQIDQLADETDELVNLVVEKNGMAVYLYQAKGDNAVELDTHEGKRVQMHCTAVGKALLAYRPREEVERIIDEQGLPAVTSNTITEKAAFFDELETIREQAYAVDEQERLNGLRCIAAPITDSSDRSIAAVSIACPIHRVDDTRFFEDLRESVLGTANVVELEHNYS